MGQMMDLTTNPQGRSSSVSNFNMELYKKIVRYKTAFYSFYLPIASGMLLCGITGQHDIDQAKHISIQLGEKFQIQDDYLDCFGDEKIIGKVGTDIQDHKCSWLIVLALLLCNSSQRKIIDDNYGKGGLDNIKAIKNLYLSLGIPEKYKEQEQTSYDRIVSMIDKASSDIVPRVIYESILKMIHWRQK